MGQLADVLDKVASGSLDAGVAADRIRKMKLSPRTYSPTMGELLGGSDDPYGPDQDDDGHELGDAFHGGKISMAHVRVLHPAVTEALASARARAGK